MSAEFSPEVKPGRFHCIDPQPSPLFLLPTSHMQTLVGRRNKRRLDSFAMPTAKELPQNIHWRVPLIPRKHREAVWHAQCRDEFVAFARGSHNGREWTSACWRLRSHVLRNRDVFARGNFASSSFHLEAMRASWLEAWCPGSPQFNSKESEAWETA